MNCEIQANGHLKLFTQPPNQEINEKIRFAFMGSHVDFLLPIDDAGLLDILTSSSRTRERFIKLTNDSKKSLEIEMKNLFPQQLESIESNEGNLTITIKFNGISQEILEQGSAFQKIFVCFTLLFFLIEQKEKRKIFIMEEPEISIYPRLF